MREIPPVSRKLKALQDTILAQMEREQKAREKVVQTSATTTNAERSSQQVYIPTIEDEYLMAQFQSGRYCGD